jgi:hypothetical protein
MLPLQRNQRTLSQADQNDRVVPKPEMLFNNHTSAFTSSGHALAVALVRKVPQPAVSRCSKAASLFDHLVGADEQRCRKLNTERLRGFQVDNDFKFDRSLYR